MSNFCSSHTASYFNEKVRARPAFIPIPAFAFWWTQKNVSWYPGAYWIWHLRKQFHQNYLIQIYFYFFLQCMVTFAETITKASYLLTFLIFFLCSQGFIFLSLLGSYTIKTQGFFSNTVFLISLHRFMHAICIWCSLTTWWSAESVRIEYD